MHFPLLSLSLELAFILALAFGQSFTGNGLTDIFEFVRRGQEQLNLEALDERDKLLGSYDFIVVGAGTAGCALAARLSENPRWKVLLLEAGGPENYIMDMPIVANYLALGEMNWHYLTEPSTSYCLAMKNNRCNWPRGKIMGGSSTINFMMYTRANRRDYDRWAALGNPGWSWKEVLPYFQKYEGSLIPDADRGQDGMGRDGPVKISYADYRTTIADAFVLASQQAGLPRADYNGEEQLSVSYLQATIENGTRWSSNRAYLYPIKGKRKNLHVKKNALVTRVLIDPQLKTAYGIMVMTDGRIQKVLARKEVIVSAGAINTPQLLMLSGVGPAKHLREVGIKPIADLAVGYNLQDHVATPITFPCNATSLKFSEFLSTDAVNSYLKGRGPLRIPGGVETISFYALGQEEFEKGWPDIELFQTGNALHFNPALRITTHIRPEYFESLYGELDRTDANSFMILPMILRPKSRGRIKLRNRNPLEHPLIYANYFSHPYDLDIIIQGIQQSLRLIKQPAFRAIGATLLDKRMPGCGKHKYLSWNYWACYVRHFSLTIYHYSGTAKMGPRTDPSAVVDARLRVHGINNLRVVDASIMPYVIAGHPNGPVFMIAEKAADMIKQDHNYN